MSEVTGLLPRECRDTVRLPQGLEITTQAEWDDLEIKRFHARVWLRLFTGHLNPIPRYKTKHTPNFLRTQAE